MEPYEPPAWLRNPDDRRPRSNRTQNGAYRPPAWLQEPPRRVTRERRRVAPRQTPRSQPLAPLVAPIDTGSHGQSMPRLRQEIDPLQGAAPNRPRPGVLTRIGAIGLRSPLHLARGVGNLALSVGEVGAQGLDMLADATGSDTIRRARDYVRNDVDRSRRELDASSADLLAPLDGGAFERTREAVQTSGVGARMAEHGGVRGVLGNVIEGGERYARALVEDPLGAYERLAVGAIESLPGMALGIGAGGAASTTAGRVAATYAPNYAQTYGDMLTEAAHDPATGARREVSAGDAAKLALAAGVSAGFDTAGELNVGAGVRRAMGRTIGRTAATDAAGVATRGAFHEVAGSTAGEFATGAAQSLTGDLAARATYDPNRRVGTNLLEDATQEAAAGAGFAAAGQVAGRILNGRDRPAAAAPVSAAPDEQVATMSDAGLMGTTGTLAHVPSERMYEDEPELLQGALDESARRAQGRAAQAAAPDQPAPTDPVADAAGYTPTDAQPGATPATSPAAEALAALDTVPAPARAQDQAARAEARAALEEQASIEQAASAVASVQPAPIEAAPNTVAAPAMTYSDGSPVPQAMQDLLAQRTPALDAQGGEPAFLQGEHVPETVHVAPSALKHATIQRDRTEAGLPALPEPERIAFAEVAARAKAEGLDERAADVARRVLEAPRGERTVTNEEHAGMVVRKSYLTRTYREAADLAERYAETGDPAAAAVWSTRAAALLDELDLVTRAGEATGTDFGRGLALRRMEANETYELGPVLVDAKGRKGKSLTDAETATLTRHVRARESAVAKRAALQGGLDEDRAAWAHNVAETKLKRVAPKATLRPAQREALAKERQEILRQLRGLGQRANDVFGLTAETAALVGRLALNYAKEGTLTLADVVDRLQEQFPNLTPEQIAGSIAFRPERKGREAERDVLRQIDEARVEQRRAERAIRTAQASLAPKLPGSRLVEGLNAVRTLQLSGDMGAVMRQGMLGLYLGLVTPGARGVWFTALGKSVKAFFREYDAEHVDMVLHADARHVVREAAGLYIAPLGESGDAALSEEDFAGRGMLQRLGAPLRLTAGAASGAWQGTKTIGPGVGTALGAAAGVLGAVSVNASERQYVTFLNVLRAGLFDAYADGNPSADLDTLRAFADVVNKATGRGDLGRFSQAGPTLAALVTSARFSVSRWQVLTAPFKHRAQRDVALRSAAMLGAAFAGQMALLGASSLLALALGFDDDEVEIGTNPRSPDFGKLRIGDYRLDVWGGERDVSRLMGRTLRVGTDRAGLTEKGPGRQDDPLDAALKYARYKMAPGPATLAALYTGRNAIGKEQGAAETIAKAAVPLGVSQSLEAAGHFSNRGPGASAGGAAAVFIPNFVGMGADVYTSKR